MLRLVLGDRLIRSIATLSDVDFQIDVVHAPNDVVVSTSGTFPFDRKLRTKNHS